MQPITSQTPSREDRLTRLEFAVAGLVDDRELPVEVRRADAALITRSRSRDIVELLPGEYFVLARLPDGEELRGRVLITSGQSTARVELAVPDPEAAIGGRDTRRDRERSADVALLCGHLFVGESLHDFPPWWPEPDETGRVRLRDSWAPPGPGMLRYRRPGAAGRVVLWPIPDAARDHAAFQLIDDRDGLEPRLDHPQADLVLGYLRQGALAEAEVSSDSVLMTAGEMLRQKRWDPLAAALGAYLLLRHHALDGRAQTWGARLREYNPSLPDAYCINAELLARDKEHAQALDELLCGLNKFGLPFFTEGLTLAGSRLARYLRVDPDDVPWLDDARREEARLLLTRLDWLGAHRVLGRPVLTLEGFDPSRFRDYKEFWEIRPIPCP